MMLLLFAASLMCRVLQAVGVESASLMRRWTATVTGDSGHVVHLIPASSSIATHVHDGDVKELTQRFVALEVDFDSRKPLPTSTSTVKCIHSGTLHAFLYWWTLHLDDHESISNCRSSTSRESHWSEALFLLSGQQRDLVVGECMGVQVSVTDTKPEWFPAGMRRHRLDFMLQGEMKADPLHKWLPIEVHRHRHITVNITITITITVTVTVTVTITVTLMVV